MTRILNLQRMEATGNELARLDEFMADSDVSSGAAFDSDVSCCCCGCEVTCPDTAH